jgi:hypothetical protein
MFAEAPSFGDSAVEVGEHGVAGVDLLLPFPPLSHLLYSRVGVEALASATTLMIVLPFQGLGKTPGGGRIHQCPLPSKSRSPRSQLAGEGDADEDLATSSRRQSFLHPPQLCCLLLLRSCAYALRSQPPKTWCGSIRLSRPCPPSASAGRELPADPRDQASSPKPAATANLRRRALVHWRGAGGHES